MDASEDAKHVLEGMESIDQTKYDLRRLHEALQHDIEVLSAIWDRVKSIRPKDDVKLETLKEHPCRKAARPKGPDLHVLQGHGALPVFTARESGQSWRCGLSEGIGERSDPAHGQRGGCEGARSHGPKLRSQGESRAGNR